MTQSAHPAGLSMLEKRKIEAEILKEACSLGTTAKAAPQS